MAFLASRGAEKRTFEGNILERDDSRIMFVGVMGEGSSQSALELPSPMCSPHLFQAFLKI